MSKRAFIFPGQGAQYVGMAKDIYEISSKAKEFVQQAEERILISNCQKLCLTVHLKN